MRSSPRSRPPPLRPSRGDLRALPHGRDRPPARARGGRIPPRPRRPRQPPGARSRSSPSFASPPRSARTRRARSTARRATSSTSTAPSRRWPRSRRPACSTTTTGRSNGRPAVSSPAACCRGAYLAGRLPRRRLAHRATVAAPRGAHADLRRRLVPAQRRLRGGGPARGRASARRTRARTQRGGRRSRATSLAAGVVDAVLALEERSVVAEMRAEANRLANADHANLVRTARAAQRQLEAARRLRARVSCETLPRAAARSRPAPAPPSGAVAARARRAGEPARHEGRACSGASRRWSRSQEEAARPSERPAGSGRGTRRGPCCRRWSRAPGRWNRPRPPSESRSADRRVDLGVFVAAGSPLADPNAGWAGGGAPRTTSSPTVRAPRPDGERGLDPPPGSASPPGTSMRGGGPFLNCSVAR